jgi:signal transduction histidine kinase
MTPLELITLILSGIGSIALPMLIWRSRKSEDIAKAVNDMALAIARLQERTEVIASLNTELRSLRDEIHKLSTSLAAMSAKFEMQGSPIKVAGPL